MSNFFNYYKSKNNLIIFRIKKFLKLLSNVHYIRAFIKGVFAGVEHETVLRSISFNTIVDIGANRGQFSLVSCVCNPEAKIYSFEPLKNASLRFLHALKGYSNIDIYQTAIGTQIGETTIHVAAADDSSSLLPISSLQESIFPGTGEVRQEKVQISLLTDYLNAGQILLPALLKIDVQGYELEVLRGCEDLLSRFSYVYVECSFLELYVGQPLVDEVIAWLRERDWTLTGIYNMVYDRRGDSVQADFLFQNASAS